MFKDIKVAIWQVLVLFLGGMSLGGQVAKAVLGVPFTIIDVLPVVVVLFTVVSIAAKNAPRSV